MMAKYLNTNEAAEAIGVTQRSIFSYLKDGKLKGTKTVTGQWRIPESEIDRFLGVTPTKDDENR